MSSTKFFLNNYVWEEAKGSFEKKRNREIKNWFLSYFLWTTLGLGEYFGLPAVLSEELDHLELPVYASIHDFYKKAENRRQEIWLLGASYNSIDKFELEKSMRCGADSCYRKSLDESKICKPGMLFWNCPFLKVEWIFFEVWYGLKIHKKLWFFTILLTKTKSFT